LRIFLYIVYDICHVAFGFLMFISHLQTIWEYCKDVLIMFVLYNMDGIQWYLLVKFTNSLIMIMECFLACNPFVIGKLFQYIFSFRALESF
jgi:hypothetical protein